MVIDRFFGKYRFLSNFYPSPFEIGGIKYKTVEHYFQAMKTVNPIQRMNVVAADTPGEAKKLGKKVSLRPDWEKVKPKVMATGLTFKFDIKHLKEKLLATSSADLVEGNTWHDMYWGKCYCTRHAGAGENNLGKMLMSLRFLLLK